MLQDEDFRKELVLRASIVRTIVCLLFLVLVGHLYFLQIQHSKEYQLMSDKNRIRLSPILPKRGKILSSDGIVLASSEYNHRITMDYCSLSIFNKNLEQLKTFLNFSDDEIANLKSQRQNRMPNICIKESLTQDEYAKVAMNLFKFNGVYLNDIFFRKYSMPKEFSHILGYTSKINGEIQLLSGKTGLELVFDKKLKGQIGYIQHEINSIGKKVRILSKYQPINGEDLILSINAELQHYIYNLLENYKVGACCVLDMSGKVLALVSVPGYDINSMSKGPNKTEWKEWNTNPYKPLLDRAVSSSYPPGSVFKIITAYAALKEKIISPEEKILCLGGVKQDNHVFHCWNRGGHGWLNITEALSKSCDCYFFELAKKLGIERLSKYARQFGFGEKTGLELPNEKSGLIPSREWKFLRYQNHWCAYETMLTSIGQGAVLTTLIQTATMMGRLYSGNLNYLPTVLAENDNISSNEIISIDMRAANIVKQGLKQVCLTGTASGSCRTRYGISGKTGSSQVRKLKVGEAGLNQKLIEWKYRDHAFFAGVAPSDSPKYIVVVLIEHGGSGAGVAAPIARKVFDRLMLNNNAN